MVNTYLGNLRVLQHPGELGAGNVRILSARCSEPIASNCKNRANSICKSILPSKTFGEKDKSLILILKMPTPCALGVTHTSVSRTVLPYHLVALLVPFRNNVPQFSLGGVHRRRCFRYQGAQAPFPLCQRLRIFFASPNLQKTASDSKTTLLTIFVCVCRVCIQTRSRGECFLLLLTKFKGYALP